MAWTRRSLFPFGKWKGTPILSVETKYLEWIIREAAGDFLKDHEDFLKCVDEELKFRKFCESADDEGDELPFQPDPPKRSSSGGSRTSSAESRFNSATVFCTVCNDRGFCTACVRGLKEQLERAQSKEAAEATRRRQLEIELATAHANLRNAQRYGNGMSFGLPRSNGATKALAQEIISAGRRAMATKYHPDKTKDGGEKMKTANTSADWLEKVAEGLP